MDQVHVTTTTWVILGGVASGTPLCSQINWMIVPNSEKLAIVQGVETRSSQQTVTTARGRLPKSSQKDRTAILRQGIGIYSLIPNFLYCETCQKGYWHFLGTRIVLLFVSSRPECKQVTSNVTVERQCFEIIRCC